MTQIYWKIVVYYYFLFIGAPVDITRFKKGCLSSKEYLLRDFFRYYGNLTHHLNYKDRSSPKFEYILCTSNGKKVEKQRFLTEARGKWSCDEFEKINCNFRSKLCIQDPFVGNKNLIRFTSDGDRIYATFVGRCKETVGYYAQVQRAMDIFMETLYENRVLLREGPEGIYPWELDDEEFRY